MDPAPVGVERDGTSLVRAGARTRARRPSERRVRLRRLSTGLLGVSHSEEREDRKSSFAEHCYRAAKTTTWRTG